MSLHPVIAKALQSAQPAVDFDHLLIADVRKVIKQGTPKPTPDQPKVRTHDLQIAGQRGDIPARVYRPATDGPHPILVFFHGGGFVALDVDSLDYLCTRLCAWSSACVVSVEYRLAPENPFPAGLDDCLAATRWAFAHAREIDGDPAKIALAGTSAGACLAAVVSQRARDEGGPRIFGQVLFYPATNFPTSLPESHHTYGSGYGLTRAQMMWFWQQYLPDRSWANHPHVSPLQVRNAVGLPPSYLVVAECDILHDEGVAYADMLTRAEVDTTLQVYAGVNHGFLQFVGTLPQAQEAIQGACHWLKQHAVSVEPPGVCT